MDEMLLLSMVIWLVGLMVLAGSVLMICIKLAYLLIQRNKQAKLQSAQTKKRIEEKYNKIASLSPSEFDSYMTGLLSMMIQIVNDADISDRDPDAENKLYFHVLERLMVYLGTDTIQAIEYFYGKNYLTRWIQLRYTYLYKTTALQKLIAQRPSATDTLVNQLEYEQQPGEKGTGQ